MRRYRIIAYISRGEPPLWVGNEGTKTFGEIFVDRPYQAQFAILQDETDYLCVDLFETDMDVTTLEIYIPPSLSFPTLEAAVMAAQLKL